MFYYEFKQKTIEDVKLYIEYIKEFQLEKFKNGIETDNWNKKELIVPNMFFVNDVDLKKYVNENYKENTILCLKLYDVPQYHLSCKTGEDIYNSIIELENEINTEFYLNLVNRVKEQKSLTKSCNNCKSIIKIEHINSYNCPVCNDKEFLFNDTDKKNLENKISRLNKHKENYYDKSNKYYEKVIKKIEKQNDEDNEYIDFKLVLITDEKNKFLLDEDISLIELRINAYNKIYKKEEENKEQMYEI